MKIKYFLSCANDDQQSDQEGRLPAFMHRLMPMLARSTQAVATDRQRAASSVRLIHEGNIGVLIIRLRFWEIYTIDVIRNPRIAMEMIQGPLYYILIIALILIVAP